MVQFSEDYARSLGLSCIPPLPQITISKMGLSGVPGLKVEVNTRGGGRGGGRGGRGGGGAQRDSGQNNGSRKAGKR